MKNTLDQISYFGGLIIGLGFMLFVTIGLIASVRIAIKSYKEMDQHENY